MAYTLLGGTAHHSLVACDDAYILKIPDSAILPLASDYQCLGQVVASGGKYEIGDGGLGYLPQIPPPPSTTNQPTISHNTKRNSNTLSLPMDSTPLAVVDSDNEVSLIQAPLELKPLPMEARLNVDWTSNDEDGRMMAHPIVLQEDSDANGAIGSIASSSDTNVILVRNQQSANSKTSSSTTTVTTTRTISTTMVSVPLKRHSDGDEKEDGFERGSIKPFTPRYCSPEDADVFHGGRYDLVEVDVPVLPSVRTVPAIMSFVIGAEKCRMDGNVGNFIRMSTGTAQHVNVWQCILKECMRMIDPLFIISPDTAVESPPRKKATSLADGTIVMHMVIMLPVLLSSGDAGVAAKPLYGLPNGTFSECRKCGFVGTVIQVGQSPTWKALVRFMLGPKLYEKAMAYFTENNGEYRISLFEAMIIDLQTRDGRLLQPGWYTVEVIKAMHLFLTLSHPPAPPDEAIFGMIFSSAAKMSAPVYSKGEVSGRPKRGITFDAIDAPEMLACGGSRERKAALSAATVP
ncbi:hypothetical protein BJ684DRAFT_17491 [Piptocephalis cylindrospora]|uniref:Uncharacterized protein n=1 Tax=Piptocephalis cylindrospora TaxID=1907219 RepID=A0A4P9XZQ0_9FUNG|nr:hypothetical protein BJ684DRAFT_17491 [Piptocephalis cylindrospora]|eukprot:RKP11976.1 hypothetical protein BJ684DRAFT_17491 [Piptocephalis cylindrospora]